MDPELRVVQTPAIFFKLMSESSIDFDYIQKFVIKLQSRSMPNPTLSDNDFKNKMAWVLNYHMKNGSRSVQGCLALSRSRGQTFRSIHT